MATAAAAAVVAVSEPRVKLTPALLSSLAVAQSHREHKARITSLDFDATGRYCLTAGADDVLCLYDAEVGRFAKLFNSKKYGVDLARFLHRSTNVLYASTKGDGALLPLSWGGWEGRLTRTRTYRTDARTQTPCGTCPCMTTRTFATFVVTRAGACVCASASSLSLSHVCMRAPVCAGQGGLLGH
jgi:WD40 repeat protein